MYYAFAVLLMPLQRDLNVPAWLVAGAFSVALLVSALLAPVVGRWIDRGFALRVLVLGGAGGALLLMAWACSASGATVPGVLTLYATWAGLGLCMATATSPNAGS